MARCGGWWDLAYIRIYIYIYILGWIRNYAGIIADGNQDGTVDVLDSGGFYQVVVGNVSLKGHRQYRSFQNCSSMKEAREWIGSTMSAYDWSRIVFSLFPLSWPVIYFQVCPAGFTSAAGGPCALLASPPPLPPGCDGFFHNGDIDSDGSLTVSDIEAITEYITEQREFTECEIFIADGK